jgi:hypothetical protein
VRGSPFDKLTVKKLTMRGWGVGRMVFKAAVVLSATPSSLIVNFLSLSKGEPRTAAMQS